MFILKFVLLVLFLGLSAFFSASETALFSLDSIKIKRLAQQGKSTSLIIRLLENPIRCLTSILAGNTLVNIAISVLITSILIDLLGNKGVSISIGVTTFILLVFGEIMPKTLAIHNNEQMSYAFSPLLYGFSRFISPFLFLATKTVDAITSLFRLHLKKEPTLTEEEFMTIIEVGHRYGVVAKSEKEMVASVLEWLATTAQEVMTPRTDIKAISSAWDQKKAYKFTCKVKHSKIPVYKDSYDNILGVVYPKDLFLEESKSYTDLIRPVLFVPESKRIADLLKDFYKQRVKMAIVIDEYGGTSGLVTMEDILEEIFGEIYDEFEVKENLIEVIAEGVYRISGKAPIDKVNEDCELKITPGDYETIAGFLLDRFRKIPAEGEQIKAAGGLFTIDKVMGRRIRSVILEKK